MMHGCPPSGVETQDASQRRQEGWVSLGSHRPAECFDQNHEQPQTPVTPTLFFRIVLATVDN
jgi:hypothetical protein